MSRKWRREACPLTDDEIGAVAALTDADVKRKWPVEPAGHLYRQIARDLAALRRRLRRAERSGDRHARTAVLQEEFLLLNEPFRKRWGRRGDGIDPADYIAAMVGMACADQGLSMRE